MRLTIVLYALALALLIFILKFLEYHFFLRDLKLEFYLGTIAVLFTGLGVWAGLKLTRRKQVMMMPLNPFVLNEEIFRHSGISKRELEVLELMAKGCSNREISEKLFVSLNTIKTHATNLFLKLDVKRRTQAIQKAREIGLIP